MTTAVCVTVRIGRPRLVSRRARRRRRSGLRIGHPQPHEPPRRRRLRPLGAQPPPPRVEATHRKPTLSAKRRDRKLRRRLRRDQRRPLLRRPPNPTTRLRLLRKLLLHDHSMKPRLANGKTWFMKRSHKVDLSIPAVAQRLSLHRRVDGGRSAEMGGLRCGHGVRALDTDRSRGTCPRWFDGSPRESSTLARDGSGKPMLARWIHRRDRRGRGDSGSTAKRMTHDPRLSL